MHVKKDDVERVDQHCWCGNVYKTGSSLCKLVQSIQFPRMNLLFRLLFELIGTTCLIDDLSSLQKCL